MNCNCSSKLFINNCSCYDFLVRLSGSEVRSSFRQHQHGSRNPNKWVGNQGKKNQNRKVAIIKFEPCISHRISAWGPAPWPIREKTVMFTFFLPRSQKLANLYRYRPPGRPSQLLRRYGPKMPGAIVCDRWREMPAE